MKFRSFIGLKQATVYPLVIFYKVDAKLFEDHLVFISNDIKHDSLFVELVNRKINDYYESLYVKITHDIEFNDGFASQYKSTRALWLFIQRPNCSDRIYFESAHGKKVPQMALVVLLSLLHLQLFVLRKCSFLMQKSFFNFFMREPE